jgi:hypothetical protein
MRRILNRLYYSRWSVYNNIVNWFYGRWVNLIWNLGNFFGKWSGFRRRLRSRFGRWYLRLWYWLWDRFR